MQKTSVGHGKRRPHRPLLHRVEVDVRHGPRLPRELRLVEVVDVVILAVKEVEDIELNLHRLAERIAGARVHK